MMWSRHLMWNLATVLAILQLTTVVCSSRATHVLNKEMSLSQPLQQNTSYGINQEKAPFCVQIYIRNFCNSEENDDFNLDNFSPSDTNLGSNQGSSMENLQNGHIIIINNYFGGSTSTHKSSSNNNLSNKDIVYTDQRTKAEPATSKLFEPIKNNQPFITKITQKKKEQNSSDFLKIFCYGCDGQNKKIPNESSLFLKKHELHSEKKEIKKAQPIVLNMNKDEKSLPLDLTINENSSTNVPEQSTASTPMYGSSSQKKQSSPSKSGEKKDEQKIDLFYPAGKPGHGNKLNIPKNYNSGINVVKDLHREINGKLNSTPSNQNKIIFIAPHHSSPVPMYHKLNENVLPSKFSRNREQENLTQLNSQGGSARINNKQLTGESSGSNKNTPNPPFDKYPETQDINLCIKNLTTGEYTYVPATIEIDGMDIRKPSESAIKFTRNENKIDKSQQIKNFENSEHRSKSNDFTKYIFKNKLNSKEQSNQTTRTSYDNINNNVKTTKKNSNNTQSTTDIPIEPKYNRTQTLKKTYDKSENQKDTSSKESKTDEMKLPLLNVYMNGQKMEFPQKTSQIENNSTFYGPDIQMNAEPTVKNLTKSQDDCDTLVLPDGETIPVNHFKAVLHEVAVDPSKITVYLPGKGSGPLDKYFQHINPSELNYVLNNAVCELKNGLLVRLKMVITVMEFYKWLIDQYQNLRELNIPLDYLCKSDKEMTVKHSNFKDLINHLIESKKVNFVLPNSFKVLYTTTSKNIIDKLPNDFRKKILVEIFDHRIPLCDFEKGLQCFCKH